MGIADTKDGKLLYHLTKLSNLDSILQHGLLPRKNIRDNMICFADVADKNIITKRTELGLDNYTPFHFHPYSAFDVAVRNTYKDDKLIYICIHRSYARNNNFKILIRHPMNLDKCKLMKYNEGFEAIDWDTMHIKGRNDDYAKHVKMAECLTNKPIYANDFQCISVKDDEIEQYVKKKLKEYDINIKPPYVDQVKWLK